MFIFQSLGALESLRSRDGHGFGARHGLGNCSFVLGHLAFVSGAPTSDVVHHHVLEEFMCRCQDEGLIGVRGVPWEEKAGESRESACAL